MSSKSNQITCNLVKYKKTKIKLCHVKLRKIHFLIRYLLVQLNKFKVDSIHRRKEIYNAREIRKRLACPITIIIVDTIEEVEEEEEEEIQEVVDIEEAVLDIGAEDLAILSPPLINHSTHMPSGPETLIIMINIDTPIQTIINI